MLLGKEESNQPLMPVPTSPSGLIYPMPQSAPFPAHSRVPRCCTVSLAQSFRQNGERGGFPWENMLRDAIRAKNMQPLSSTFISQNKTRGFLPSGVSGQQERGKSKSLLVGAYLENFLARSQALSWRRLPGLIGGCMAERLVSRVVSFNQLPMFYSRNLRKQ